LGEEVVATTEPAKCPDNDEEIFQQYRSPLFGLAYRMLGSAVDAADIVAEAYLRWRSAPRDSVRSPKEFLATAVARLSLDALTSAGARRETGAGSRPPVPWLADELGPADATALSDSLSRAFLVMLEERSPAEHAATLLPGLL
jgi:RNA polymerase sigma-70 factor, ECF subfamily